MIIDTLCKRDKGFTLGELVITIGCLAVLSVGGILAYQSYQALSKYAREPSIKVESVQVLGDSRAEKFIEFNGEKYFAEIDGTPVGKYVNRK